MCHAGEWTATPPPSHHGCLRASLLDFTSVGCFSCLPTVRLLRAGWGVSHLSALAPAQGLTVSSTVPAPSSTSPVSPLPAFITT